MVVVIIAGGQCRFAKVSFRNGKRRSEAQFACTKNTEDRICEINRETEAGPRSVARIVKKFPLPVYRARLQLSLSLSLLSHNSYLAYVAINYREIRLTNGFIMRYQLRSERWDFARDAPAAIMAPFVMAINAAAPGSS